MAGVDGMKRRAAEAAVDLLPGEGVIGVGTGSTADHFIDALGRIADRVEAAVASSRRSAERLAAHGIRLLDLNDCGPLAVYVDGADEADPRLRLIKGGGGALTREKIVAAASERFVCIADESKLVERLGAFPLPIEVIPMARALVARAVEALGGRAVPREGFVTDNGNAIVDVHGFRITDPEWLESELNQLAGVVAHGLFARRPADLLLLGTPDGVRRLER